LRGSSSRGQIMIVQVKMLWGIKNSLEGRLGQGVTETE
jgi:hypothetical protein